MILVRTQKSRILIGMQTVKTRLRRLQLGTGALLAVRLEVICVALWKKICLHPVHVLRFCGRLG